jgi:hypothetical protein
MMGRVGIALGFILGALVCCLIGAYLTWKDPFK